MIKVFYDGDDLHIEGHAKREVCAAVSAAVQTALACVDFTDSAQSMYADETRDHGGLAVIHVDMCDPVGRDIIHALTWILRKQSEVWPGEIEIDV